MPTLSTHLLSLCLAFVFLVLVIAQWMLAPMYVLLLTQDGALLLVLRL